MVHLGDIFHVLDPFCIIYLFIYVATADPACKNLTIKTDFFFPFNLLFFVSVKTQALFGMHIL